MFKDWSVRISRFYIFGKTARHKFFLMISLFFSDFLMIYLNFSICTQVTKEWETRVKTLLSAMPPKASTCGILCMDQQGHLSSASMIREVASSKNVDTLIARIYIFIHVNVNNDENNIVDNQKLIIYKWPLIDPPESTLCPCLSLSFTISAPIQVVWYIWP